MSVRSVVAGVGSALPKRRVDNAELAEQVDTSDQWIVERTGIRSRYLAGEGETTATLARDAALNALEHAGVEATEVGLIVLATATPDQTFPSSATKVQAMLGIDDCIAFDVHAVCTGLCADGRRFDDPLGIGEDGAGDRRRDLQPDPRLGGSRHLRPVWRRRRRARPEGRGG